MGLWRSAAALAAQSAASGRAAFPEPASLEPAVRFWVRVYTQIDTNSGFLHDADDLSVIYETVHFAPRSSRRERERLVRAARDRYAAALRRIATSAGALSAGDERIRALWGEAAGRRRLLEAADDIRFQLGQSDRFREGLERSGRWQKDIGGTLARFGLPVELAALPQVESSFNPRARSKDGAAGLWQFMRSTGRRYLRINSTVDERLDPFSSTEAAAQLLAYDHRLLGTWPLAITAYNHGAAGMRRAEEQLGTSDIGAIVRDYRSPTFGFASRNFYASFLAVLQIDRDPGRYFGPIRRDREARFQEVRLPFRVSTVALERVLHIDRRALRDLNPALRPVCWYGRRDVPKGYLLRLPVGDTRWTANALARRLQSPRASEAVFARAGTRPESPGAAQPELTAEVQSVASIAAPDVNLDPLSVSGEDALGPPGAGGTGVVDPIDYSVAGNGTIVVAAAETLGHYAEWLGVSAWTLRRLNHMRFGRPVVMGHRIKLTFRKVSRQAFEAQRLAYHRSLEASYFAAHHISGTETYVVRRGDSLWNVTRRYEDLPIWLLEQYNPDVDFGDMRPGSRIVVPRVEEDAD
jgi:peptidoglycan lytic transglycosylase D